MALDLIKLRKKFDDIIASIGREELEEWLQNYDHYFDQSCKEVDYFDSSYEYFQDMGYEQVQDKFDKKLEKEKIKKYCSYSYHRHSDNHRVGDDYPWTIAHRVLNKFIGKPFDDAFNRFCQLVPKYQQRCFLEEFEGRYASWFVDDDGNILPEPPREKRKTTYKVASWDAKYDWISIRNKDEKERRGYKYPSKVFGLVEGEEFIFNRPDHKFKRLKEDQRKKKSAQERKSKKKQQEEFSVLLGRISRERRRMEYEKNLIKIISHGFDPKTSFRPDNQK